ncbi:MAG: Spy/CpxP family protein refolding chaperone [Desulfuromonadaceae bacterium]|nr:Spy/CpxP family protein refolding chaperone [Desulfuromonadaceae bacterium]
MNRSVFKVAVPATLVVMVAFLSAIFFAGPNTASAATAKKKAPAVERLSAVEHTEARIKLLQDALKITDSQKESWDTLTQVMRENARVMDALRKDRATVKSTMNAIERLKFHSQISEIQLDQLKKLIPAFEALYVSMSDEQKASTDAIMQTGRHGKKKIK